MLAQPDQAAAAAAGHQPAPGVGQPGTGPAEGSHVQLPQADQLQAGSPAQAALTGRHQQQTEAAGSQQPGLATGRLPQAGAQTGAAGLQQQTGDGSGGLESAQVGGAGQAAPAEAAVAQEWRDDLQGAAMFEQVHRWAAEYGSGVALVALKLPVCTGMMDTRQYMKAALPMQARAAFQWPCACCCFESPC